MLLNQKKKVTERFDNNPDRKRMETCRKIPFLITPTYQQTVDKPFANQQSIEVESKWKQNTLFDHDVKGLTFSA